MKIKIEEIKNLCLKALKNLGLNCMATINRNSFCLENQQKIAKTVISH